MRKQSPMLQAVAMGFRVLMVYGCFSMPWNETTALTRQSAYAVPGQSTSFINVSSTGYRHGRAGKGCFNPATPYDAGPAKVAECLTHQGHRGVQPSLQGQAMLPHPSNGAPANVLRWGGAAEVALSTPVAPPYLLENQNLERLPPLPCHAVLPG